ncbi:MAG: hypothetical protein M3Q95_00450 [Bacteroidota bacterium]|nr:hypothetical protein [Bacteroidota bacterium]
MLSTFIYRTGQLLILGILFFATGCKGPGKPAQAQIQPGGDGTSLVSENGSKTFELTDYFNGYNAQMLRGPSWQASGFVEQVKGLYPGLIRYPGGTVSSYWDWKTGWFLKDIPLRKEWKSVTIENPIKLEDLKFACDKTGARPLFVLNMMTSTLNYQIEMLEHASKIGLPVQFVELDNEFYLGDEFYIKKYPTGKEYGEVCNEWIAAIKQKFKGVKVGIIGNSIREGAAKKEKPHAQRGQNWNRDLLAVVKNADAMTFHVYGGGGMNYLGNFSATDDEETAAKANAVQQAFDRKESIQYALSIPFIRWNNSNTYDYKILPSGMKAWITEYNLFEREGVVAGTWAHGLYALMQSLLFMENQDSELICYHNLTTTAQFAAIFNSDNAFYKAVKQKPTPLFGYTAAGHCLALSGKAMDGGGKATQLKFTNNEMISAARGQQYPSLYGWKITGAKGTRIIVANLSAKAVTTDFKAVAGATVRYTQIHAEPHLQIAEEKEVNRKSGTGQLISLPPYSVTLIEGD